MPAQKHIAALSSLLAFLIPCCTPKLDEHDLVHVRLAMVEAIRRGGVHDESVLAALRKVPRHRFLHGKLQAFAYEDRPLSIGYEQSASAPSMIARMLAIANPHPTDRILELRTGCGYQTALLAELGGEVFSVEIVRPLAESAGERLEAFGYGRVRVKTGSLFEGWAEQGPYNLIFCAAAPDHIPQALLDQLADGGRMILPLGDLQQELVLLKKKDGRMIREDYGAVRFGPMLREEDLTPGQK